MRAARIHRYGGPERLVLEEVPRPMPGAGDLLVEVKGASVNPVDFKTRDGKIKSLIHFKMPITLGSDLSGVVVAVGAGVTRFRVGDEIYSRVDKDRLGAFADFALVSEAVAAPRPVSIDHIAAASIPLVGLTAWQALVEIGEVKPGHKVLIHAGSGGVGSFAIQLARHLGATVSTTGSAKNAQLCKDLGAHRVIDYRTERFEQILDEQDFILDTQGGETLERCFSVIKSGGTVVSIGGMPDGKFGKAWGLNPILVLALRFLARKVTRLARRKRARYEYLFMRPDAAQLVEIGKLIDAGVIKPLVERTFPLAQIREAMAAVESGRTVGKVVIVP